MRRLNTEVRTPSSSVSESTSTGRLLVPSVLSDFSSEMKSPGYEGWSAGLEVEAAAKANLTQVDER